MQATTEHGIKNFLYKKKATTEYAQDTGKEIWAWSRGSVRSIANLQQKRPAVVRGPLEENTSWFVSQGYLTESLI